MCCKPSNHVRFQNNIRKTPYLFLSAVIYLDSNSRVPQDPVLPLDIFSFILSLHLLSTALLITVHVISNSQTQNPQSTSALDSLAGSSLILGLGIQPSCEIQCLQDSDMFTVNQTSRLPSNIKDDLYNDYNYTSSMTKTK